MTSVLTRTGQSTTARVPLAPKTDGDLLRSFAERRDGSAERDFAELVRRHGPMVLGVCRHLLRDPHDAEDAFQATFLVLARRAGSIGRPELLAHWLKGVAIRVARQARGQVVRRRRVEGCDMASLGEGPIGDPGRQDRGLVRRETERVVHEELGRLPEKYRSPVVLCDLGGLTHAEAAGRLRWPIGSVSVRLRRARGLLRERLGRRGLAPTAGLFVAAKLPPGLAEATARASARFASGAPTASAASTLAGQVLAELAVAKALVAVALPAAFGLATVAAFLLFARNEGAAPSNRVAEVPAGIKAPIDPTAAKIVEVPRDEARSKEPRTQTIADPAPARPQTSDLMKAYADLARRAGRDADAQVRLALWCEARGLTAARLHHLSLAILKDPAHSAARALLGQVMHQGRWRSAEDVGPLIRKDGDLSSTLETYEDRRSKASQTGEGQWRLALWCDQVGLKDEAQAHASAAIRLNPDHFDARKWLGFKKVHGRWVGAGQAASEQAQAEALRTGDLRWRPILARWRSWLDDPKHRASAERGLLALEDPHAVTAVWAVFANGPADQSRAVQLLGQIDSPAATFGLAAMAVFSPHEPARRAASETLVRRDSGDAVAMLVGLLVDPEPNPGTIVYRYQCLPIGALGVGSPGITIVEGRKSGVVQTFTVDESFGSWGMNLGTSFTDYERRLTTQRTNQAQQLQSLIGNFIAEAIREAGAFRTSAQQFNGRVILTLRNITKVDRGGDWEPWKRWWVESQGYAYKPEQFRNPPDLSIFEPKPLDYTYNHLTFQHSCFGAGTPVQTLNGPKPIESIRVGDRVLAQDVEGGKLEFEPVLAVHHNRPAETLEVGIGEGSIVVTGIHRFWVAGVGWTMARDLQPGELVRTVKGVAPVRSIKPNLTQPVYNLEVGRSRTFFVGDAAALVHDNSRVEPVARPFGRGPCNGNSGTRD